MRDHMTGGAGDKCWMEALQLPQGEVVNPSGNLAVVDTPKLDPDIAQVGETPDTPFGPHVNVDARIIPIDIADVDLN